MDVNKMSKKISEIKAEIVEHETIYHYWNSGGKVVMKETAEEIHELMDEYGEKKVYHAIREIAVEEWSGWFTHEFTKHEYLQQLDLETFEAFEGRLKRMAEEGHH